MKKKLQLNKETMAVLNMSEMSKVVGQAGLACPPDGNDVLLPHEVDCGMFYRCEMGTPILMQCPGGLHFNAALSVCDYPENAGCAITPATAILTIVTLAICPTTITLVSERNTCPSCKPGQQDSCGLCG